MMNRSFLHSHSVMEADLGLTSEHVIVHKRDWIAALTILNTSPTKKEVKESQNELTIEKTVLTSNLEAVKTCQEADGENMKEQTNFITSNLDDIKVSKKGYNSPPVKKLDPILRPVPGNVSNKEVKKFREGTKHDADKPRFDLIPADALEEVAKVYTVGAKKYGDRNWEKGLSYGRLFGAMMRHAWGWWKGERDDEENKLHHLSSVIFCALGLLHYELNSEKFKKFDDRNLTAIKPKDKLEPTPKPSHGATSAYYLEKSKD